MKRLVLAIVIFALIVPGMGWAQRVGGSAEPVEKYPEEVLEKYYECMERYDLDAIKELLWYHRNIEKIDASVYGLPVNDFDDPSLLTIDERLQFRKGKSEVLARRPDEPRQATSGPQQYPHHLRHSLDNFYKLKGERPDCSEILNEAGVPTLPRGMEPGWASDLDLTTFDTRDRGEVDIVIDYANPNRIMASSVSAQGIEGTSDLILYSDDWGQNWTATGVGNNSGTGWECDPVSYYQRSTGNVYHSKIGCTTNCNSTYTQMRYSTDNGANWADCARPDNGTGEDRQWHVVDNTPTSACYGNIYITWHNSNQEKVATSSNNCSSWVGLTSLTNTGQAITPDINVAADGHAYVVWQNFGDATFKIAGSDDCGATWTSPSPKTVKTRLGDWKNNIPAQCVRGISTMPNVDVDRCPWSAYYGRVYMAMFDFDQSGCGSGPGCSDWSSSCDYDIWFTYSDNEGSTWAPVVNITRDILGHGDMVDSFMGYMRVDESDGSIYIGYHRTRLNPSQLSDREKTHYFMARSIDGGATWEEIQLSTEEGDEKVSGASTFERGDYNHIDVFQGVAYPVFVDRRGGTGEENVITRKICTEPSHRSERAPTFTAPPLTMTSPGAGTVNINWTAPDAHWGDGGENVAARKYQLWVDGSLAQDNILWTSTSISGYNPGDCNPHDYVLKVINQCGIEKDYQTANFGATGCCADNPDSVDVTPDGPLTLCQGTGQLLTVTPTGGNSPFTYQWLRDGSAIGGATLPTFTANESGIHSYNCAVEGGSCTPGTQDGMATQITWQSVPTFAGITSAVNGSIDNPCTINLEWDPATSVCPGPFTYRVYRSTVSGVLGPQIASGVTCSGSPCTYSDTDTLVSGTPYYYVVRAYDAGTTAEDSNTVEAPATPSGSTPVPQQVYFDDFDGNRPTDAADYWMEGNFGGTTSEEWHMPNTNRSYSTNTSYKWGGSGGGDYADNQDAGLILGGDGSGPSGANGFAFGAGSQNLRMTFWHTYDAETDWDGCYLMYTTTDAVSGYLQVPDTVSASSPYIISGGYTGTISSGGVEVWNGDYIPPTGDGFTQVEVNLDYLAGSTAWFAWRCYSDTSVTNEGYYLDDINITGELPGGCTTGSSCTDPGAVTIASITDDDACAQDGVTITFSGGAGASSFDLWVDGAQTFTGISSPYAYNPGDTASHSYVVRAIDTSCFTDSGASSFTDAGLGTPSITSITDDDQCVQDGIRVNYTAGTDATSHDLLRDGTPVVTGYVSGALYDPGSSTSYTYTVRANMGASCTEISGGSAFADAADAPGAPLITLITDNDTCAQNGINITYLDGSGAASHDLWSDGALAVTGYISGALYNPADSSSHNSEVYAVNGSCTTKGNLQAFTDDNNGLATPGAPTVNDDDACAQSGMTISWGAVSGATSYEVRVDGTTTIYSGAGTSFGYDPGNSNSHTYDVQASNASCTSSWSGVTTATDEAGAPGTPGVPGVADVSSCALNGVQITWGAVSGATSYDLWVDGTTLVTGVTSGVTYSPLDSNSHNYQVRAVNVCGDGAWSTGTAGIDGDHSFSWAGIETAADRDACDDTGVALRWSTPASWNDGGGAGTRTFTALRDAGTLASGLSETTIGIDDTTGTNGTSYDYSVEAFNAYGCSAGAATTRSASDEIGGEPTFGGLSTVAAMPGDICGLRLDWSAASSNCSNGPTIVYNVYRSTSAGFTPDAGTLHDSCVADLYYEDHTIVGGTTYYYVVRAEDSSLGHDGPCGNGFEDTNTTEVSGAVSSGASTVTLYSEDFDALADGNNAGWTYGIFSGDTVDWRGVMTCTAHSGAKIFRVGGTTCLADFEINKDSYGTPPIPTIDATWTNVTLNFWHRWNFQGNSGDGASLWIDLDSSGTFTWVDSVHFSSGAYTDAANGWWDGNNTTFVNSVIDLDAACDDFTGGTSGCAGHDIEIAFNLTTNGSGTRDGWFIDDVVITADQPGTACSTVADPVQHFAARSTSGQVKLEWQNPQLGAYSTTRVCVDTGAFPTNPATCTLAAPDQSTGLNNYDTMLLAGTNGTTYYFAAFVDNGSGEYSPAQTVTARPFDTTGQTKWAYHTSATALAPPGLYPGAAGTGASYGVSNDRVLHGMNSTGGGGDWPRTAPFDWMPMGMNGPAQSRPPIVPATVGAADLVAFLGSQDGHVYAVNAKSGQTLWQSATNYGLVQGAPAGMFTAFGGAYDLLFAGSRVAGSGNSMNGINLADGTNAWTYGGTMGIISSGATVDYATNRLYFASRENPTGSNNTLWCLQFTDSGAAQVWAMPYGDIDSAPVLFDGVLYIGTNAGEVYAVNPATGERIWSYATHDGPVKGYVDYEFITGASRRIFFATTNTVWALMDNGPSVSLEWERNTIAGPSIPLTLAYDGVMYVGSTDGRLYQLDSNSGAVATSVPMGAGTATVGSPGYDWLNSLAYVGAEDGSVYAVTLPLSP